MSISPDIEEVDAVFAIAQFSILQESLTNIIKYARASHVKVALQRQATSVTLQIMEDGIGMAADALNKPRSHGLVGMRERTSLLGGTLTIGTGGNNLGTCVEASIPFVKPDHI